MLNIKQISTDGKITFNLSGRLDTNTSGQLDDALKPAWEAGDCDIIMDLSDLQYVSSAGLRVFLTCEKKCRVIGKSMTLTGVSQTVREIFDIVGFSGILTIE
ncbi:MAG: STAS domain-containing protein [Oscillospiraceae bacterium]|nr:STAS domain-containing protein [Oscillospiraceae bacterium]